MWCGQHEYLASAPKYNLLYEAFGWEVPHLCSLLPVMRDAQNKMSKRHGDPSYEDLKAEGYLTEAILNYVALLGWSPKGELAEQELFTPAGSGKGLRHDGHLQIPPPFSTGRSWITSTPSICGAWPRRPSPRPPSPTSARR